MLTRAMTKKVIHDGEDFEGGEGEGEEEEEEEELKDGEGEGTKEELLEDPEKAAEGENEDP